VRILAIIFAACLVLCAFGLLAQRTDPRLARLLFGIAALLGLLLLGGFFGLIGG
jgi:hypothetical protein